MLRRCKFLVNANFLIDLARNDSRALQIMGRFKGRVCTTDVVLSEFKGGRRAEVKKVFEGLGGVVVNVPCKDVFLIYKNALFVADIFGITSPNSFYDLVHIITAGLYGLEFVTGDRRACKRASRLSVSCLYYKEGGGG